MLYDFRIDGRIATKGIRIILDSRERGIGSIFNSDITT